MCKRIKCLKYRIYFGVIINLRYKLIYFWVVIKLKVVLCRESVKEWFVNLFWFCYF